MIAGTTRNNMALRDFLSVPYLVVAQTLELEPGRWMRCASHPELPDCRAEAPDIESALERLERRRIEVIIGILRAGAIPPVPRPPLGDCDPERLLQRVGLHEELAPYLDHAVLRPHGAAADRE